MWPGGEVVARLVAQRLVLAGARAVPVALAAGAGGEVPRLAVGHGTQLGSGHVAGRAGVGRDGGLQGAGGAAQVAAAQPGEGAVVAPAAGGVGTAAGASLVPGAHIVRNGG